MVGVPGKLSQESCSCVGGGSEGRMRGVSTLCQAGAPETHDQLPLGEHQTSVNHRSLLMAKVMRRCLN